MAGMRQAERPVRVREGRLPTLLVIGATDLARDALAAVAEAGSHVVIGVLDDDPRRWAERIGGAPVLGGLDLIDDYPDADVVICAADGAMRESIATTLDLDPHRYARVVHPSARVAETCCVGAGSILLDGVVLTSTVSVRRHVVAMRDVVLTHDDVVGDFATLGASVTLGGDVHIGERAYVGRSASVRENLAVGDDAVIGMGAVVLRDVPQGETWFGAPARRAETTATGLAGALDTASDEGEQHA